MEIQIKQEYQHLVPPLSTGEYEQLKQSIAENGMYEPITVNSEGEILDGHNRYKVCKELGIEPTCIVKSFSSPEDEQIYVLESNITRRQLTEMQRIALVHDKLEPLETERARNRQLASLKTASAGPLAPLMSNEANSEEKGRVNEIMAGKAGVSPSTYYRAKVVLENAPEDVVEKTKSGDMSIAEGYRQVRPGIMHKSKEATDFLVLPSELFATMKEELDKAIEQSLDQLKLRHNRHTVVSIGDSEIALTT